MNKILLSLAVMLLAGRALGDLASDAKAKYTQGDFEGAITDYTLIIQSKPDDVDAYNQRGLVKNAQRDWKGAIADFSKAIELKPKDAEAYKNRGDAESFPKDEDAAIADFSKAIELNPNDAEAYYDRSLAKGGQHDLEGAIADCTTAIELEPKYAIAYEHRTYFKIRKGDFDGALADAATVVKLEPNDNGAYCLRGMAKQAKHDFEGAIADYTKATSLEPYDETAYILRSSVERAKGDTNGASADFKKGNLLLSKTLELHEISKAGKLATTAIIRVTKDGPQTGPDKFAAESEKDVFTAYDAIRQANEKLGLSKLWEISDEKAAAKIIDKIKVSTGDEPGLYTVACYGLEHDLAVKIVNELCVFATERPYGESINGGPSQAVHVTIVKRAE